ncbi:hypothetical protein B0H13DRAFT_2059517 [Mycena leptocephala]|nr:hypothetical protein B0H13DRAFT_2059517 [Mycena leptocephala]
MPPFVLGPARTRRWGRFASAHSRWRFLGAALLPLHLVHLEPPLSLSSEMPCLRPALPDHSRLVYIARRAPVAPPRHQF